MYDRTGVVSDYLGPRGRTRPHKANETGASRATDLSLLSRCSDDDRPIHCMDFSVKVKPMCK